MPEPKATTIANSHAHLAWAIDPGTDDETIKIPLVCLRFDKPDDGLPVLEDWLTTLESMLFGGIELSREPPAPEAWEPEEPNQQPAFGVSDFENRLLARIEMMNCLTNRAKRCCCENRRD